VANNNLAAIPEIWAREGLMVLTENAPAVAHVDRQYSNELASYGDTVNAFRADKRKIRRKSDNDGFSANDANLTPVPVKLDQWFYDTIVIKDGEMSKSIASLTQTHLVPVMQGIARAVDRAILGRVHEFLGTPSTRAGKLGGMSKTNSADYILEAQEVLHTKNAPAGLKFGIVHQTAQTFLQGNTLFAAADQRGSATTLTTGEVGTIYNTGVVMSQNVNHAYAASADTEAKAVNNGAGYPAGTTSSMTVDGGATNFTVGEFVVFEENGQPTYATAATGATAVTLNEALKYAVTDDGAITHYLAGVATGPYAVGHYGDIEVTHTSGLNLQVGQLLAFNTGANRRTYTVLEVTSTTATTSTVLLDRPLEVAVGSSDDCFPGPAGGLNLLLHPEALAFVSRPLAIPDPDLGVRSSVQVFNGIGLRVTMGYLISGGGLQVNVDLLAGVKPLNTDLACVLLS